MEVDENHEILKEARDHIKQVGTQIKKLDILLAN